MSDTRSCASIFVEPGGSRMCVASVASDHIDGAALLKNDAGDGGRSPRSRGAKVSFCGPSGSGARADGGAGYISEERVREEDVLGRGGTGSMSEECVCEEDVLGRGAWPWGVASEVPVRAVDELFRGVGSEGTKTAGAEAKCAWRVVRLNFQEEGVDEGVVMSVSVSRGLKMEDETLGERPCVTRWNIEGRAGLGWDATDGGLLLALFLLPAKLSAKLRRGDGAVKEMPDWRILRGVEGADALRSIVACNPSFKVVGHGELASAGARDRVTYLCDRRVTEDVAELCIDDNKALG